MPRKMKPPETGLTKRSGETKATRRPDRAEGRGGSKAEEIATRNLEGNRSEEEGESGEGVGRGNQHF